MNGVGRYDAAGNRSAERALRDAAHGRPTLVCWMVRPAAFDGGTEDEGHAAEEASLAHAFFLAASTGSLRGKSLCRRGKGQRLHHGRSSWSGSGYAVGTAVGFASKAIPAPRGDASASEAGIGRCRSAQQPLAPRTGAAPGAYESWLLYARFALRVKQFDRVTISLRTPHSWACPWLALK